MNSFTVEQLTDAILTADSLTELKRMVGDSEYFNKLEKSLSKFDKRIELGAEFSEQALEDGLNVMQATESYFSDQSFDLSSLIPLKGECKPFSEQVKDLSRPYAAISEQQQNELLKGEVDFYRTNGGLVVTFGFADGGFALMPLNAESANRVLANQ